MTEIPEGGDGRPQGAFNKVNIVKLTSFLRNTSYSGANQSARIKALGDRRIPTTAVVVALLDPKWLVEIKVIAAG